jgi:hypothetical protein
MNPSFRALDCFLPHLETYSSPLFQPQKIEEETERLKSLSPLENTAAKVSEIPYPFSPFESKTPPLPFLNSVLPSTVFFPGLGITLPSSLPGNNNMYVDEIDHYVNDESFSLPPSLPQSPILFKIQGHSNSVKPLKRNYQKEKKVGPREPSKKELLLQHVRETLMRPQTEKEFLEEQCIGSSGLAERERLRRILLGDQENSDTIQKRNVTTIRSSNLSRSSTPVSERTT